MEDFIFFAVWDALWSSIFAFPFTLKLNITEVQACQTCKLDSEISEKILNYYFTAILSYRSLCLNVKYIMKPRPAENFSYKELSGILVLLGINLGVKFMYIFFQKLISFVLLLKAKQICDHIIPTKVSFGISLSFMIISNRNL